MALERQQERHTDMLVSWSAPSLPRRLSALYGACGSVARRDTQPDSAIDRIADFGPVAHRFLPTLAALTDELRDELGQPLDRIAYRHAAAPGCGCRLPMVHVLWPERR
jgi:predicted nucleotidyltransferase